MSWQALGAVDPRSLTSARQQAHRAAQLVAAAGETLLAHEPDTSHTTLGWSDALGALQGHPIPAAGGARLALRLAPFGLVVADARGAIRAQLPLAGSTLAQVGQRALEALGAGSGRELGPLVYPDYELPPHPLAKGAPFEPDEPALAELQRWFGAAHAALAAARERLPDPGPILCWPHHFDIATLASVERDAAGAATKTVGVGLSPGDEQIDEPYWYVSHWPSVPGARAPSLPLGEWTEQGFAGGLLRASELTAQRAGQRARVASFLDAAMAANLTLLGAAR